MMEFAVNPETAPILVSTTRAVAWLNPRDHRIRAASRPVPDEGVFFREVVQAVVDVGVSNQWGNVHPSTKDGVQAAIDYVTSYDITPVQSLRGPRFEAPGVDYARIPIAPWLDNLLIVIPLDREYLGFLLRYGCRGVAVIHNACRGIAVAGGIPTAKP